MFDFADAIKSIGEAFTSLFNYFQTSKEVQCETQIVKDKNRLKKATNIAEEIFDITDEYSLYFTDSDSEKYIKLRRKFDKRD